MKVQIVDEFEGKDVIIWEHTMEISTMHNSKFRMGSKPHMKSLQQNIDCLSVAKNQAVEDALHHFVMYVNEFGTYNKKLT